MGPACHSSYPEPLWEHLNRALPLNIRPLPDILPALTYPTVPLSTLEEEEKEDG